MVGLRLLWQSMSEESQPNVFFQPHTDAQTEKGLQH